LDLYIDAEIVGFIDYKIKDEFLKKIYISHISIDAYYQRNGLGTYLINCLKKEFNTIALLSISKSLNIFYEKNNFEEDLFKTKLKNNTNYVWTK
jgi:ribosomal protein S18 acetylase RimI-like enzyme